MIEQSLKILVILTCSHGWFSILVTYSLPWRCTSNFYYICNPWLQICAISKDHGAEIYLNKDARKVASQLTEQNSLIAEKSKAIKGLTSVSTAYLKVSVYYLRNVLM